MENKFYPALFISEWDFSELIQSDCLFNPITKEVKEIENIDIYNLDLNMLTDEYILFNDKEYRDFINLDNE